MLKFAGCGLILAGTVGGSFWVRGEVAEHMKLLYGLRQFLFRLSEDIRYSRQPIRQLLKQHSHAPDEWVAAICEELARRLEEETVSSPQKEWETLFFQKRKELKLSLEETELLAEAGNAFFGKCIEENQMYFGLLMDRFDFLIAREREKQGEKQKVLQSVVLMGGALLILVLL